MTRLGEPYTLAFCVKSMENNSLKFTLNLSSSLLTLTLVWALLLGTFFASGFYNSDDISYLMGVQALAGERIIPADPLYIGSFRLGVTAFPTIGYVLGGRSIFLAILSTAFYLPILVLITFLITKKLHTEMSALLAAIMVAHFPLFYFYSGTLLPDNPFTVWLGITMLMLLTTWRRQFVLKDSYSAARDWRFVLCGVCLGMTYATKESALVMLAPIGVGMVLFSDRWLSSNTFIQAFYFAAGLVLVLITETLIITSLSGGSVLGALQGDYVLRLSFSQSTDAQNLYEQRIAQQGLYPLERLAFLYKRLSPFLTYLLLPLAVTPVLYVTQCFGSEFKARARLFVWISTVWLFLYLTFGSTNFLRYLPPPIQHQRYFAPVALGLLIMLSGLVGVLIPLLGRLFRPNRLITSFLIILILAPLLFWVKNQLSHFGAQAGQIYRSAETKAFLSAYRDATLDERQLPVIIGHYPSRRLEPLFLAASDALSEQVFLTPTGRELDSSSAPEPPFLLIVPRSEHHFDRTRTRIRERVAKGELLVEPYLLGKYISPAGRFDELRYLLYPLRGKPSELNLDRAPDETGFDLLYIKQANNSQ